ncbi:MAG TPA: hypothetical protein VK537_01960, partial [Galbitalea sp.]|nr:hypothetical protein [Galbitalea sp.]
LAGCVQPPPRVIPTSEPSSAPVFASDAAALAAAKKAYASYLAVSDAVAHDGGSESERLATWDSKAQLKRDEKSFAAMHADGHRTTGSSTFSNLALQSSELSSGKAEVVVYVCLDISKTTLLDDSGTDVGSGRPLTLPLEVSLVSRQTGSPSLIIDRSVTWSGTDFCS